LFKRVIGLSRLLLILVGLVAISTGITGVFTNLLYGEGYLAAAGLVASLSSITLGTILFIMGVSNRWSR